MSRVFLLIQNRASVPLGVMLLRLQVKLVVMAHYPAGYAELAPSPSGIPIVQ